MSKKQEVAAMIRTVQDMGCVVTQSGGGHYKVKKGAHLLGTIPAVPSDPHSMENCIRMIRRSLRRIEEGGQTTPVSGKKKKAQEAQ